MTIARIYERTGTTRYWYQALIVGPKRGCSNSHRCSRPDERQKAQTAVSKIPYPAMNKGSSIENPIWRCGLE